MAQQGGKRKENWSSGDLYEAYVGRWSKLVAGKFLAWLDLPGQGRWLDVGCGTGMLTATIVGTASPLNVTGLDPSEGFLQFARKKVQDSRASFDIGDARAIPFGDNSFDAVVSGLVLNFVPEPEQAAMEMARVTRQGGTVAAYVWDYMDKMELMRYFWNAAVDLNPQGQAMAEDQRFPICNPEPLAKTWGEAGLAQVKVRAIDVSTPFRDFDDYWAPFLGGQGPAPSYAMSLSEEARIELRDLIRLRLPVESDGSIHLIARAWAVRGKKPE